MRYKIVRKNSKIVAANAAMANTFYSRLKGLMFSESMKGFDALIIDQCKSIHTFFMKYPIDVIFMDKKNRVVKIKKNIAPWKITSVYFRAAYVIELMGGSIENDLEKGEKLDIVCIN